MIPKNKTFLSLLIFFSINLQAQLCVIYDSDGYTNVRADTSLKSKIINKVIEKQVFPIATFEQEEENKSKEWIAVNTPISNNYKSGFLEFRGEEKLGYIHISRITKLEDLPVFNVKEINPNKIIHSYGDIILTIETQKFEKSKHKIVKTNDGGYIIDGKIAFPYYGENTNIIKSIKFQSKKGAFQFPQDAIKYFFMITTSGTNAYLGKKGELYLEFSAGDGADAYSLVYCINDNKLFSMTVTSILP